MNEIKILIIGSGERIRQVILPALHCMQPKVKVAGIHSRTQSTVETLANAWGCRGSSELTDFDFNQIDLIIIAITKENNPQILQKLIDLNAHHLPILLDTPPVHLSGLRDLKWFKRFTNLYITEDEIAHPYWQMATRLIQNGKIGRLQKVWLYHSAYRYHGFARLRWLSNGSHVLASRATGYPGGASELHLRFANGLRGTMIEPFTTGHAHFMMTGTEGTITTMPISLIEEGTTHFHLSHERKADGRISHYLINGDAQPANRLDQLYFQNLPLNKFEDHSAWNLHKIRGVMELIEAIENGASSPYRYTYQDANYDYVASTMLRRLPIYFDPLSWFGSSLISLASRLVS